MIILDTNVISEVLSVRPDPQVVSWLDALPSDQIAITAVTAAELRVGVAVLPAGRRRELLGERVEALLAGVFGQAVLPFDDAASRLFAEIMAGRRRTGRPLDWPDAQIAAIARSYDSSLATRDVTDFVDTGVELVNPWAG